MEVVFSWVKNIVVFFLVFTLLEEMLPDSDYKKYIRVAGGMVFILVVFSPLLKLLNMDDSMNYFFQWESFKTALAKNQYAGYDSFDVEAAAGQKESWVFSQYKENIQEQICLLIENEGYSVYSVHVQVDESGESDTFGSIRSVEIVLEQSVYRGEEEHDIQVESVEPVIINGSDNSNQGKQNSFCPVSSEDQLKIKQLISNNYGVSMNGISISMEDDGHG